MNLLLHLKMQIAVVYNQGNEKTVSSFVQSNKFNLRFGDAKYLSQSTRICTPVLPSMHHRKLLYLTQFWSPFLQSVFVSCLPHISDNFSPSSIFPYAWADAD